MVWPRGQEVQRWKLLHDESNQMRVFSPLEPQTHVHRATFVDGEHGFFEPPKLTRRQLKVLGVTKLFDKRST